MNPQPTDQQTKEILDRLEELCKQIETQDNRATSHPFYCVMQRERILGMDPDYGSQYEWRDVTSGDYCQATPEEVAQLEKLAEDGEDTIIDGTEFERHYYVERDRFITGSFTEEDAKEHLRLNGHNLPGAHIYVTSLWRTPGMILLRESLPLLLSLSSRTLTAEAELQKAREELESISESIPDEHAPHKRPDITGVSLLDDVRDLVREHGNLTRWKAEALVVMARWDAVDAYIRKHPKAKLGADVSKEALRLLQEGDSLRSTIARMEGALKSAREDLMAAMPYFNNELAGLKAGYSLPVSVVARDQVCDAIATIDAALQHEQSAPPLAQTAMDWDERLPYVPEKKTEGLPAQSAAKVEEPHAKGLEDLQTQYRLKRGPEYEAGKVLARYLFEHPELERLVLTRSGADGGGIFEVEPTPPQEQKTGGEA